MTVQPTTHPTELDHRGDPGPTPQHRWSPLLIGAVLTWAVAHVAMMAATGEVIPPLVAATVLGVAIAVLATRRLRVAAWVAAAAGIVHLGVSARFLLVDGQHPESPAVFLHTVFVVVGITVSLVAAFAIIRSRTTIRPRWVLAAATAVAVAGTTFSAVAALTTTSDPAGGQDATLVAERIAWVQDELTVPTGGTLYLDNRDLARHTFTIEDTDVDVELPGGRAVMLDVELAPGTYGFICDVPGHEMMVGTLTVTS